MKTKNRGMLGVDREGDRGSYAILAQIFGQQTPPQHKKRRERACGLVFWARPIQKWNFPEIMPAGKRNVLGCCGACQPSGKCHRDRRGRFGGAHSLLAERFSERPGCGQGRADRRERSGPLTARTALADFPQEGMAPFPSGL
jgi:hypothetical protein